MLLLSEEIAALQEFKFRASIVSDGFNARLRLTSYKHNTILAVVGVALS